jgi:hypothetical protein
LPIEGVTCGLSQNLVKKTVTVIKKWREGKEEQYRVNYRKEYVSTDLYALQALEESVKRNKEKNDDQNKVVLENTNFVGTYINIEKTDRSWVE